MTARIIEGIFIWVGAIAVVNLMSTEAGIIYLAFILGATRADVYPSKRDPE